MTVWQGPPMERARYSISEPPTFYVFLRLDGVYGKTIAQVYGGSRDEATRRARVVRIALEQHGKYEQAYEGRR